MIGPLRRNEDINVIISKAGFDNTEQVVQYKQKSIS